MNAPTTRRLLLAVALSGAVLTGCVPAGATGTATGGCDPNGFGPFSGCGDTSSSTEQAAEPVSSTDGCDPSGFGPFSGCGDEQDSGGGDAFASDDEVTPEDMAETARHEAWHIAAAHCYGWTVVSSTINTDGSGDTSVDVPVSAPLNQMLTLFVAGAVADGTDDYSLDDLSQAGGAMHDAGIPPADRDRLVNEARSDAARCAATQAARIDRDTADLLEDGEL